MSFGSIVGGVVGFALGGPPGAAIGAGIGGSKAAADAAKAAEHAASDVVDVTGDFFGGAGKLFLAGGTFVLDAVGDLAKSALGVVYGTVAFRSLRHSEREVAIEVFGSDPNVMPLDRVVLCSAGGLSDRPFTVPGSLLALCAPQIPALGPALLVEVVVRHLWDKYIIFIGLDGYNHGIHSQRDKGKMRPGQTTAHELTHVWQGHHKLIAGWYMWNSVYQQCVVCKLDGTSAYAYSPGKQWDAYHAEQQASIVENWFANRTLTGSSSLVAQLQPYIDSNIRTGKPHAKTIFPTTSTVSSGLRGLQVGTDLHLPGTASTPVHAPTSQADALLAQAHALEVQANAMIASGNPLLRAQGEMLLAQSRAYSAQAIAMGAKAHSLPGGAPLRASPAMAAAVKGLVRK